MDWKTQYKPERKPQVNWNDIGNAIHDSVSMEDVLTVYAPHVPRKHHRCPCPLHNGKDYNFSYTESGYKCFVCGESGDVISFVKTICELPTRTDAMKRINSDLNLRLPIDYEAGAIFRIAAQKRQQEAEKRRKTREEWDARYNELIAEYVRLDKGRMSDPSSAEYAEAVKWIDYVEYLLDCHLQNEPR